MMITKKHRQQHISLEKRGFRRYSIYGCIFARKSDDFAQSMCLCAAQRKALASEG
jgi:hypothetical protein